MVKLDSVYDKSVFKNISIKLTVNHDVQEEINYLNETISYLHETHNHFKNQYNVFLLNKININPQNLSNTPSLDVIRGKSGSHKYVNFPKELEDVIVVPIITKKQLEEVDVKFGESINFISNYIQKITLLKQIHYRLKKYIRPKKKIDYPYKNFDGLKSYISTKSLMIRHKIVLKANQENDSYIEQVQAVIQELTDIKRKVTKLLSLDENSEYTEEIIARAKHLIDILGLNTIYQIHLNDKFETVININNKNYSIKDIINECHKVEKQLNYILNQTENLNCVIENCLKDKKFIATYKEKFNLKEKTSLTTLRSEINDSFKKMDCKLRLTSPNNLYLSMEHLQKHANLKYLQATGEKIEIFLSYNQENKSFDTNKIISLMQIFGLSIQGFGLNGFGEYVLYSNYDKSMFRTLEDVIKELSRFKAKIEMYISKINFLLKIGKQCLEYPQFFAALQQSYLTNAKNIESYLNKYKAKLDKCEVDSETNITEVEEKALSSKYIYSELIELEKHVKYVFDLVYKGFFKEVTIAINESNPNKNISEIIQSVDSIGLEFVNRKKIELVFLYGDTKATYLNLRDRCKNLNYLVYQLNIKAEKLAKYNEKLLQQVIEQSSVQQNQTSTNKALKSSYIQWFAICLFICGFWAFILYEKNSDDNVNSEVTTTYHYYRK
ncbi:hypothetical protein CAL7102_08848 [Dulcicalothrix desertica PCC 7102]|nr:hypothetical protein CAL7102_08848 [Dulcicalothrix desertica PCC 7102]